MSDIYEQYDKAFSSVSAYAVMREGEHVANICFKYPKDGAGVLYAYVHWICTTMVRGHARGYGYDKRAAALANASTKIVEEGPHFDWQADFVQAISKDLGRSWQFELEQYGFKILNVVTH